MKHKMHCAIIGSGIAGLSAALTLSDQHDVTILTKKQARTSATSLAQGGIAGVLSGTDSVEQHIKDTIDAGAGHNALDTTTLLSIESRQAVEWLDTLGVNFDRNTDGSLNLALEGGHSTPRIAHVKDETGRAITNALLTRARERAHLTILENCMAVNLVLQEKIAHSVEYISEEGSQIHTLAADIFVVATGGLGELYRYSTNLHIATGDGHALAIRAGLTMQDMEFIQFHPTVLLTADSPLFLLSEALRGAGAHIVDEAGRRFLFDVDSRGELASRDLVSRAVFQQMKKTSVYLDTTHMESDTLKAEFPAITSRVKEYGFDMSRELVPITPAAHYSCGGIRVNEDGVTDIHNVYAVGEVACTGVQGANRLASNSLLEGVVFGRRAGRDIENKKVKKVKPRINARDTRSSGAENIQDRITPLLSNEQLRSNVLILQRLMWDHVGIVRTKYGLNTALTSVQRMSYEFVALSGQTYTPAHWEYLNMLTTATSIIKAALARTTSLGAHSIL